MASNPSSKEQQLMNELMRLYPQVRTLVENMCCDGALSADKLAAQAELKRLLTAGYSPDERLPNNLLATGIDPKNGSQIGQILLGKELRIGPSVADRLIECAKARHDRTPVLS